MHLTAFFYVVKTLECKPQNSLHLHFEVLNSCLTAFTDCFDAQKIASNTNCLTLDNLFIFQDLMSEKYSNYSMLDRV